MKNSAPISILIKTLIFLIVFLLFFPVTALYAETIILSNVPDYSCENNFIIINSGSALYDDKIDIEAQNAILVDYKTGNVLWGKNSEIAVYPASITKIMTGILAIENIADYGQTVQIPESAAGVNNSAFKFTEGDSITLLDLIKAALISSHNNATIALAEYISGSNEEFVKLMNKKAKELRAYSTNFENTNGLDDTYPDHKSTAYDIALIARYCMENNFFREIVGTESDNIILNGESISLDNTNKLLKYEFIKGIKTGYTNNAGYCLVSFSDLDGLELIAVVLNSNFKERENDIIKLIEWAYKNIKYSTIIDSNEITDTVVLGSDTRIKLDLYPEKDISKMIHSTSDHINIVYDIDNDLLKLPFDKNTSVGSIEVFVNDNSIGSTGIISKVAVDEPYIHQNISNKIEKQKVTALIYIFAFYFFVIVFIIFRNLIINKS